MDPKGKVALVTGGAAGIGFAYSKMLLKEGAKVVVVDINDTVGEEAISNLAEQFGEENSFFVKADVSNITELKEAFQRGVNRFKQLDIVINNAGIMQDKIWETEIDINLKGVINGMLLAFDFMSKERGQDGGLVVNISSIVGLNPLAQLPIYSATKAAVAAVTRAYGHPLHVARTGVTVAALCPKGTETQLLRQTKNLFLHDGLADSFNELLLAHPVSPPEDVANVMLYVIKNATPGSVWVSDRATPLKVDFSSGIKYM